MLRGRSPTVGGVGKGAEGRGGREGGEEREGVGGRGRGRGRVRVRVRAETFARSLAYLPPFMI